MKNFFFFVAALSFISGAFAVETEEAPAQVQETAEVADVTPAPAETETQETAVQTSSGCGCHKGS